VREFLVAVEEEVPARRKEVTTAEAQERMLPLPMRPPKAFTNDFYTRARVRGEVLASPVVVDASASIGIAPPPDLTDLDAGGTGYPHDEDDSNPGEVPRVSFFGGFVDKVLGQSKGASRVQPATARLLNEGMTSYSATAGSQTSRAQGVMLDALELQRLPSVSSRQVLFNAERTLHTLPTLYPTLYLAAHHFPDVEEQQDHHGSALGDVHYNNSATLERRPQTGPAGPGAGLIFRHSETARTARLNSTAFARRPYRPSSPLGMRLKFPENLGPYPEGWAAGSMPIRAVTHIHNHREEPYPDYLADGSATAGMLRVNTARPAASIDSMEKPHLLRESTAVQKEPMLLLAGQPYHPSENSSFFLTSHQEGRQVTLTPY
jgi:hypothetical protein